MIRTASLAVFVIVGFLLAACDSATEPSPVTGLTIDGRDAMLTGQSVPFRAINSVTGASVPATWTSSNASVAAVDASGLVTGLKHGSTRLEASFQGVTASSGVEVVNNFEGLWDGVGTIRRCDEAGRFSHEWWPSCAGHSFTFMGQVYRWGGVGWPFAVVLRLAHSSDVLREVTGTDDLTYLVGSVFGHCDVYGPAVPLAGHISNDGQLTLSGSIESLAGSEKWEVAEWDTDLTAPGEMRGRWVQGLTIPSGRSYWEVEVHLKTVQTPPCAFR